MGLFLLHAVQSGMPLWGPGALALLVRFLYLGLEIAVGSQSAAVGIVALHLGSGRQAIKLGNACCLMLLRFVM